MSDITKKQEQFCREFVIDNNGKQAAIRAKYSPNTAESQASRLLSNAKVLQRILELQKEISEETKIDATYVRNRHYEIDQMDFLDIVNDDGGLKPVTQWPKVWRQYVSFFEMVELFEGSGDERRQIGILKKIKWPDKVKNLELLGKHVDVQAYNEKHSVDVNADFMDELQRGISRVRKNNEKTNKNSEE